jgi:hypothetical protein
MPSRFPIRVDVLALLVTVAMIGSVACGGSTTPASPTPTPQPQPPPKPNVEPTIVSLTASGQRVDADADVTLTAVVEDAETPLDQLAYQWSSTPIGGDFIGTGAQIRWRAPHGQTTPAIYSIKLTVVEKYVSAGQPAQHEVSRAVDVHYNDSPAEVRRIGMRFLTELFPDFAVAPASAVQDFSDSCPGKFAELSDITNNRKEFQILSGTYSPAAINFDSAKTSASLSGQCTFVDIPKNPSNPNYNRRESVTGVCSLTAVYESWRWYLCTSAFRGIGTTPLNQLRYRVPGQIDSDARVLTPAPAGAPQP